MCISILSIVDNFMHTVYDLTQVLVVTVVQVSMEIRKAVITK